jgi:hypothetical protein
MRWPATEARHVPVHAVEDFAADHPPRMTVAPRASISVHVPVIAPAVVGGSAVQVPMNVVPPLLLALHVFDRALRVLFVVLWRMAACALTASAAVSARSSSQRWPDIGIRRIASSRQC